LSLLDLLFVFCLLIFRRMYLSFVFFFFSSRRRHTISKRDWSSDVCSSDLISYHSLSWRRQVFCGMCSVSFTWQNVLFQNIGLSVELVTLVNRQVLRLQVCY